MIFLPQHCTSPENTFFYLHFPVNTKILAVLKCLVQLLGKLWQKYRSVLAWISAWVCYHIKQSIDLFQNFNKPHCWARQLEPIILKIIDLYINSRPNEKYSTGFCVFYENPYHLSGLQWSCEASMKLLAKNQHGVEVHLCLKWLYSPFSIWAWALDMMEANVKDSFHLAVSGHMIEYARKDHSRIILSALRDKLRSRSKQPCDLILTTT